MTATAEPSPAADQSTARADAQRMLELFDGDDTHHGTYNHLRVVPTKPGQKVEMKDGQGSGATTAPGAATLDLWLRHLDGSRPLGVRPVRDDGMCRWGVIDVDDYGVSHADLFSAADRDQLPVVVCRSKSGGAHLLLFATDWMPQADMHRALWAIRRRLDIARGEVFPPESGKGNWLNMPYFRGDETDRHGVKKGGLAMTTSEFLRVAEGGRQTPQQIGLLGRVSEGATPYAPARTGQPAVAGATLADALARLSMRTERVVGATPGNANNELAAAAFDMARYCRDTDLPEDEARQALLRAWSCRKAGEPDGGEREFADVWRRQFEAGQKSGTPATGRSADLPIFERVVKVVDDDETTFHIQIDGDVVVVTAEQWNNQRKFNVCCMSQITRSFLTVKQATWDRHVIAALEACEVENVESGLGRVDEFLDHLREFLTNRWQAADKADISLGKPWHDDEAGRYYFRLSDLQRHLRSVGSRVAGESLQKLGGRIRTLGGDKTVLRIEDRSVKAFWLPADTEQLAPPPTSPLPPMPSDPI